MSALENFQQTVGALYPVEFPFGAFSKMKKKKKKAQRPRLEREMVEICEKWVCLASSAPLWRYSVTSVLELSAETSYLDLSVQSIWSYCVIYMLPPFLY